MMTHNLTACLMCRTPCYPNILLIYIFPFCFLVCYVYPKLSLSWYCFAHQDYVLYCVVLSTQILCFLHVVLCIHTLFSSYVLVYPDSVFIWRCFVYLDFVFPGWHLPSRIIIDLVFPGWHFPSRIISFLLLVCFSLVFFVNQDWFHGYVSVFSSIYTDTKKRLIDNTIKLLSLES